MTSLRRGLALLVCVLPSVAAGAEELPPRAVARLGDHRFYHGPGISCAVLSPDGSRVASAAWYRNYGRPAEERAAYARNIVLWNAATGERIRELQVPQGPVWGLAFSPDGKRLATDCGESSTLTKVIVFEVDSGKVLWQIKKVEGLDWLQFSADGKRLHLSQILEPTSAWDAVTGKELRLWKPPPRVPATKSKNGERAWRGMLSPDGKTIAWEMYHPDASNIGQGDERGLRVHDACTDRLLYQKEFTRFRNFVFSPDGKRFAADCGKLTVWETATGKEVLALDVPERGLFTPLAGWRRAVIYDKDSRVRLWDLETGKPLRELYPGFVPLSRDGVTDVPYWLASPQVLSADGKTLLFATGSTLRLFDTTTGKERAAAGHRTPVRPRFSADGRTLFTCCSETRRSWDVSGQEPALLNHELRKTWEIRVEPFSADDRLVLDCTKKLFRVRETATGRILCELEAHDGSAAFALFSPDATRVLVEFELGVKCSDGLPNRIVSFDTRTGKALAEIKTGERLSPPEFSPGGWLVAWADRTNVVHLHDSGTGKLVRKLRSSVPFPKLEPDRVRLLFSPDGESLLMMTSAMLDTEDRAEGKQRYVLPTRLFHVSSGGEIGRFCTNPAKMNTGSLLSCTAWSPDGHLLAVAEEDCGIVRLIEIASGKVCAEFTGHRHGVHGLAFSPDGKTLVSGGEDNVVFLWDVTGTSTGTVVKDISEKEMTAWWADLAAEDAERAGGALASLLLSRGQAVALVKERLRPVEAVDEKHLARLIVDLDAGSFAKRESASRELAELGEQADGAMRRALKDGPTLELKRRLEALLDRLERSELPPQTLQALRAVEVLEHLGTPDAMQVLRELARGVPEARLTREAKASLDRLTRRTAGRP